MAKYINLENLDVSDYVTVWDCNCSEFGSQTVMAVDDLNYLPTVEAEPVRHGYWIAQDEGRTRYMCSECKSKNHGGYEKYCPNCGAKMDKEV